MKYTVSGSTLQYKVGLTLSFLSLISRGVGGIQKGNTSILYEGSKAKRVKVAQQLDLLPETSEKLFEYH